MPLSTLDSEIGLQKNKRGFFHMGLISFRFFHIGDAIDRLNFLFRILAPSFSCIFVEAIAGQNLSPLSPYSLLLSCSHIIFLVHSVVSQAVRDVDNNY